MSRTKGHSFEREIAARLRGVFPKALRELEYQKSKALGVDLGGTGRYRVQCKRFRKYANPSRISEIRSDGEFVPVLVTKADRGETLAVLPLDHLIELIETHEAVFGGEDDA